MAPSVAVVGRDAPESGADGPESWAAAGGSRAWSRSRPRSASRTCSRCADSPWFDHLVVDPEYYDAWARQIAAGDWLGDRAFYMDPLYPYVLGGAVPGGRTRPPAGAAAERRVQRRRVPASWRVSAGGSAAGRSAASPRSGSRSTSPTSSTSARSTRPRSRCCSAPRRWRSRLGRVAGARASRRASRSPRRR